jgi:hypothetical protein
MHTTSHRDNLGNPVSVYTLLHVHGGDIKFVSTVSHTAYVCAYSLIIWPIERLVCATGTHTEFDLLTRLSPNPPTCFCLDMKINLAHNALGTNVCTKLGTTNDCALMGDGRARYCDRVKVKLFTPRYVRARYYAAGVYENSLMCGPCLCELCCPSRKQQANLTNQFRLAQHSVSNVATLT